jgi:hypothetical protein
MGAAALRSCPAMSQWLRAGANLLTAKVRKCRYLSKRATSADDRLAESGEYIWYSPAGLDDLRRASATGDQGAAVPAHGPVGVAAVCGQWVVAFAALIAALVA